MRMKKLAVCISLATLSLASTANDNPSNSEDREISRFYAGFGLGLTRLEPDTNGTIYNVADKSSEGGKLYLGYDLNEKFSLEAYYSMLGEAKISPNGSIDYEDMGANLNYFFAGAKSGEDGLGFFVRAGLGKMKNSTDLPYRRDNDMHMMFGTGLQYGFGNGWALRADVDLYDGDSKMLALGINKHFGSRKQQIETPPSQPEPVIAAAVVAENPDIDGDGVVNTADQCPDTAEQTPVDKNGCKLPKIIALDGVLFASNSDELVGKSTTILDSVAETLSAYPSLNIEVAGHTDWQGSASFNQALSEKRAEKVRQYLIQKGISADLLSAKGYGESQPIADNKTAEGRAANRRVELHLEK